MTRGTSLALTPIDRGSPTRYFWLARRGKRHGVRDKKLRLRRNRMMNRFTTISAMLACLLILARTDRTSGDPEKTPSIKEIMGKAHKGPNSILPNVGKDLRDTNGPDWDEIQKSAKELVSLGKELNKN